MTTFPVQSTVQLGKQLVLDQMDVLMQGLMGVNKFVVRLSPIGIFAIAASAAGSITLTEFGRLQGYIISHTLIAVILALWVLPMVVAVLMDLGLIGGSARAGRDSL